MLRNFLVVIQKLVEVRYDPEHTFVFSMHFKDTVYKEFYEFVGECYQENLV